MIERLNPNIIILGSSRVLQFRKYMFSKEMINAGQAMNSIIEGITLLNSLLFHNNEVVIIGIDPWWFATTNQYDISKDGIEKLPPTKKLIGELIFNKISTRKENQISFSDAITFYRWIYEKKFTSKMFFNPFFDSFSKNIGVRGRFEIDGYGPDGSYYYIQRISGDEKDFDDVKFNGSLSKINSYDGQYGYELSLNDHSLNNFKFLINALHRKSIKTILYFPPLAPDVYAKIISLSGGYTFLNEIKKELFDKNIKFFDFTNPDIINSNNCEFLDGLHPGEITSARILLKLAQVDSSFKDYIKYDNLDYLINKYKGHAFVPDIDITHETEVDFLQMNCNKID